MKARPVLQGAGFATLYILPFAADFLTPSLGDAYHRLHPLTTIYRAILLLTIGLWIVTAAAFWLLERLPDRWRRFLWIAPSAALFWLLARGGAAAFQHWPRAAILSIHMGHFLVPGVVILGLGLLLLSSAIGTRLYDSGVAGIRILYMLAGFGMLVILPQIGKHAIHATPREQPGFVEASLPAATASSPRIVWILMDELSYDQVFDHRVRDVELPNFDRLARSGLRFSAVQPFGNFTEEVLPALLLGQPITVLLKPTAGPPTYRSTAQGTWQKFNQDNTIFADARSLGWTTGVAGWYNPYCRLLSNVLDRCFWQYSEAGNFDLASSLSSTNSIGGNIAAMLPFRYRLLRLMHRPIPPGNKPHRDDYIAVMTQARSLLNDSRIRFAFIHLPVPHAPGIYDRNHHALSDRGNYLDNLVLADQSLGELQSLIESTSLAAHTTLIVSSDHSWRTLQWKGSAEWSDEEEKASRGQFDPRPVLMIHLSGQNAGMNITRPVNVLIVHTILEGLLRGQLHTSADVSGLIEQLPAQSIALQSADLTDAQSGN